jgi:hypothetical protein
MKQKNMKTIYKMIAAVVLIFASVVALPVKAQGTAMFSPDVFPSESPKITNNVTERAPFEESRPLYGSPNTGGDANREHEEVPVPGGVWILAGLASVYGIVRRQRIAERE